MSHLELVKVNHINAIVDGYDGMVEHLERVFGAQLNMPIPGDPGDPDDTDACLITVGGVIFELFAPHRRSERGQGRLLDRFGDHYVGIEYQVLDLDAARSACEAHQIRILNDPGNYFFTYPGSCLGISFELFDGDWHTLLASTDRDEPIHPAQFWRDEHPLGIEGLARISVAVQDLDAAASRLGEVTGSRVVRRAEHPQAAATGAELQIGDATFELLAPTGEGPVARYLGRYGERIRSTVFRVRDIGRVERHLKDHGVDLVPGDRQGAMAVPPEQNHNLLFEFTEERPPTGTDH